MLQVIRYIRANGIDSLERDFGIIANKYDDRITLNYSQIDSPKNHPIVRECRGLILSWPDLKVLSRAFDRFYNWGEDQNSESFPFEYAICMEKLDGSIISIYHDGGKWQCATRKMAFAEGETALGNTFASVVERAFGQSLQDEFEGLDKKMTYIFEVVSPETRVVTPYKNTSVYLIGSRVKETGADMPHHWLEAQAILCNWKMPKIYKCNSIEEVLENASVLPAMEEGYVLSDDGVTEEGKIWRIKVKNPAYLAIAHLRGNGAVSEKRIAILVIGGDEEEYLSYFPEDRERFNPYIEAWEKCKCMILELWEKNKNIDDQKEFALAVKDTPFSSFLFQMRKGAEITSVVERMSDNAKERLLQEISKCSFQE
jgi:hypothetical protein